MIAIETLLPCSVHHAFKSWTDAETIKQWWGDSVTYHTVEWTSECRIGGQWRAVFETPDGSRFGAHGHYDAMSDPNYLEWSWCADWNPGSVDHITMRFLEHADGTRLVLSSNGSEDEVERAEQLRGWTQIIDWLVLHHTKMRDDAVAHSTNAEPTCRKTPSR